MVGRASRTSCQPCTWQLMVRNNPSGFGKSSEPFDPNLILARHLPNRLRGDHAAGQRTRPRPVQGTCAFRFHIWFFGTPHHVSRHAAVCKISAGEFFWSLVSAQSADSARPRFSSRIQAFPVAQVAGRDAVVRIHRTLCLHGPRVALEAASVWSSRHCACRTAVSNAGLYRTKKSPASPRTLNDRSASRSPVVRCGQRSDVPNRQRVATRS